jgi:Fe-S cluster assembly protein SufD
MRESMETSVKERTRGFSREAVEELSRQRGEPDWVRDKRLTGWGAFESTPMPTRTDEEWRRTDLRRLPIDAVTPFNGIEGKVNAIADLPPEVASGLVEDERRSGLTVQIDSNLVYAALSQTATDQGVIFTDLATAIEQYPDLIKQYFMTEAVPVDDSKFAALHGAFWSGGTFVYVPANVHVEVPLHAHVYSRTGGSSIFPHMLIVAEEGSSVIVVDAWASTETDGEPMIASNVVEIIAKEASQVRYIQLQDWGRTAWNFTTQCAVVSQDAVVNMLNVSLGSRLSRSLVASNLVGPGSTAEMLGLYFADEKQHMDHQTRQMHIAPYATSDLLYKGAIKDRARTVYLGVIKVFPDAQRTDAYQANRNLLLSRTARADTMPELEIGANDVRCTHGATVGQVEEEYIFYLMSRGINRTEAVKLIVDGFCDEVIERVPVPEVQEEVRAAIARKIGL